MIGNEIRRPLSVLDDNGQPQNFGWSCKTDLFYDPVMVAAPRRMLSETERFIVHSPTHMIIFEIRDDSLLGYMGISVISLRDKRRSTQTYTSFLPMGDYDLPTSSEKGTASWRRKKTHLDFISMENGYKIIKADIPKFGGRNRSLRGALILSEAPFPESLVTNQTWRGEKNSFRYSRCSPWYTVEGVIQLGSSEIFFTKGNGWGIFDWNRCVRPKADIRYWAAACGMIEGKVISFCAGYSWADSSHGTENGFFVDGKLHKLDQVTFHIHPSDWLSPWHFTSNDNRLDMTFTPHQQRTESRRLFIHNITRRQICGFFSGKVQLDDGSEIEFNNLTGLAERCKTRF